MARFTHLSYEYSIVPISLDLFVQAIGIERQIRVPIEGVNRYRNAISQSIDIPIGISNSLLSRVGYTSSLNPCSSIPAGCINTVIRTVVLI